MLGWRNLFVYLCSKNTILLILNALNYCIGDCRPSHHARVFRPHVEQVFLAINVSHDSPSQWLIPLLHLLQAGKAIRTHAIYELCKWVVKLDFPASSNRMLLYRQDALQSWIIKIEKELLVCVFMRQHLDLWGDCCLTYVVVCCRNVLVWESSQRYVCMYVSCLPYTLNVNIIHTT